MSVWVMTGTADGETSVILGTFIDVEAAKYAAKTRRGQRWVDQGGYLWTRDPNARYTWAISRHRVQ